MENSRRFVMRLMVVGLLAAVLVGIAPNPAAARELAYRFVVMGDNRTGGEDIVAQPPEYLQNIDEINQLDLDFVINVGDLIRGYVDDDRITREMWAEFERVSSKLTMPLYRVFGNHDVWDAPSQCIAEELYGDLFYSFTYKGAYFGVLCSDLAGEMDQITGDQLEWFQKDLHRRRRYSPKFVFVHKPLWYSEASNWMKEVHPLLARYRVDMVFAGHAHRYEKSPTLDGVQYFITGGAGAPISASHPVGGFFHYMQVSVRGDRITLAVVKTGHVRPETAVTGEMFQLAQAIGRTLAPTLQPQPGRRFSAVATSPIENLSDTPMTVSFQWMPAPQSSWEIEPATLTATLSPQEKRYLEFAFQADWTSLFDRPAYTALVDVGTPEPFRYSGTLSLGDAWMVRSWSVIGPFELGGEFAKEPPPGFLEPYPPENTIDLAESYSGKTGPVRWMPTQARADGYVDLNASLSPADKAVAYALCYVRSPNAAPVRFSLGSGDGVRVWVNDVLVHSHHARRGPAPDQDVISADFHQGWNKLLLKIENFRANWGFYLRLPDPEGLLEFSPSPPQKV